MANVHSHRSSMSSAHTPQPSGVLSQARGLRSSDQSSDGPLVLARWMLGRTRQILAPLAISTVARICDQMLGVFMLAYAMWQVGLHLFVTALHHGLIVPWVWHRALNFLNVPQGNLLLAPWDEVLQWLGSDGSSVPGALSVLGSPHSLIRIVVTLVLLALVKAMMRYLEQFSGHYVAFKALEILRTYAFSRLYPQAPALTHRCRSGDLLVRVTKDVDRIEVFFAHTIAPLISAFITPVLTGVFVGVITYPVMGLIAWAGTMACQVLIVVLGRMSTGAPAHATLQARSDVAITMTDVLNGQRDLVTYELGQAFVDRLGRHHRELLRAARPYQVLVGVRRAITHSMMLGTVVALWGHMVWMLVTPTPMGLLWVIATAAAMTGVMRSWECVRGVEDFSSALSAALSAASRLKVLTDADPFPPSGSERLPDSAGLSVSVEHVSYSYPLADGGYHHVLHDVSLHCEPGQWVTMIGPTGCGKSTVATLIARFDDPSQGVIRVGGRDIRTLDCDNLRERVVYLPQRSHLFHESIADNLRLGTPCASEDELWWALEVAGVDDDVRAMDQGLHTRVGQRGQAVSGGQRQRLALARTILMRPSVMILDEATAHVSDEAAAEIRRRLRAALPDTTIIDITHGDYCVDSDQVIVMDDGRVWQER